jgi:Domain of unknown function (DUF6468)
MSWLQDYGVVFDGAIILLLVITIGYAMVLNRKLGVLRQARGEMEKVFADFAAATGQAESGLKALQQGSGEAAVALAGNVSDACRLADEMAFLVKKGNEIADRLEVAISASRKVGPLTAPTPAPMQAAAPLPQAPAAGGADRLSREARSEADAAAAARGIAKLAKRKLSGTDSELMRTLQAMR